MRCLEPLTFSVVLMLLLLLSAEPRYSRGSSQITVPAASTSAVCPVTYPDGSSPPGEPSSPNSYANKNKAIWVVLELNGEMTYGAGKMGGYGH